MQRDRPDYRSYSISELEDVVRRIDAANQQHRAIEIRREMERRRGQAIVDAEESERGPSTRAKLRLRFRGVVSRRRPLPQSALRRGAAAAPRRD